ncbi:GVQW3 protein, partial [Acromyrmex insinuator]
MERSLEQRYAIKFCVRLGKNATETFQMLQEAFKDDCISRSQSGRWHKAFKEDREEVADEPRSGRPTTVRTDEEVLRSDRRLSIQYIADTLNMSTFAVHGITFRLVVRDRPVLPLQSMMISKPGSARPVGSCQKFPWHGTRKNVVRENSPPFQHRYFLHDKFLVNDESLQIHERWHGHVVEKTATSIATTIRAIICGPSNCGKTNVLISLLESPNGVRFENVYVYSKSLQQPKYRYLENLFTSIDEIGYFTFSNNSDIVPPSEAHPNSIFIFDDVACDKQDAVREYFSMGRHAGRHANRGYKYTSSKFHRINELLHVLCSDLSENSADYGRQNRSIFVHQRITGAKNHIQYIWIIM